MASSSESQHKMKGWLFLDIVIRKSSSIFKLLSSEDKSLLIWWDTFLILDFSFNVLNGVCWLNVKSNSFSGKGLDEDLHTSSKSEDQVESGFLLNIVVWKSSSILKLLSSKDKSLLIWWDSFFILDFSFYILNSIGWLDIKGDCFSS